MKRRGLLLLLPLILTSCAIGGKGDDTKADVVSYSVLKDDGTDQFDFDGNYVPPELKIDGLDDDIQYQSASDILTFGSLNQASVKIYRGQKGLFCFFKVSDPDIETIGNNNGDDVTHGDSIEIYFDFKNDGSSKPQSDDIQLNIGAHGKTRIFVGSSGQWGNWNGLIDYDVFLDGSLNDNSDIDNGYQVELTIPYAQVGIDRNSDFGISLGCVARGKESTHDTLAYTWGGLTFDGSFIDPQNPSSYVVLSGNKFYSRGNVPIGDISLDGNIYDQNGNGVADVDISIEDEHVKSDSTGHYTFANISPNSGKTIKISKTGYKTYEKFLSSYELKGATNRRYKKDLVIVSNSEKKSVKLYGRVENPAEGIIFNATVSIGDVTTTTDINGDFDIDAVIDNDLKLTIEKSAYKSSNYVLDAIDLIGKRDIDLGVLSLCSPSSEFEFAGNRGIQKVDGEVYREKDGIHFNFTTSEAVTNGDHIELFIDSQESFHGRDSTDYRIDFKSDNTFSIVNFGNGSNNIPSKSGINSNCYLSGQTYKIDTVIPYSFLGISQKDVIGFSCGYYKESSKDWDGFAYPGLGFDNYVAPEYTDQYLRVGIDNSLYRALSNSVLASRIYGRVVCGNDLLTEAFVNSNKVSSDGSFSFYQAESKDDIDIVFTCAGYNNKTITISKDRIDGKPIDLGDVSLTLGLATVTGIIKDKADSSLLDGVKVYLESDNSISFISTSDGSYTISIPTDKNAYLIFEKEGYVKYRKGISSISLSQASENQTPYRLDVFLQRE